MSIKDKLNEDPTAVEGWRPAELDELIGKVVRINERKTDDYPDPYQIITVELDDGERLAFHAFHTVAKNLLEDDPPLIGDEIAIRYIGKARGDGPYEYHNYRIVVEHVARPVAADEQTAMTQEAAQAERDREDANIPF
jgi:hypothetical protein